MYGLVSVGYSNLIYRRSKRLMGVTVLLHYGSFHVTEDFYNTLNLIKEPSNGNESKTRIDNRIK